VEDDRAHGAGVSAASGVPTFRGAGGYWRERSAEELASVEGFRADPTLVWELVQERRQLVATCAPNRAHEVLADWSRRLPGFVVLTQNVDDLHDRAGTISVVKLHGSLWEVGCAWQCAMSPRRWRDERVDLGRLPSMCMYCGAMLRPGEVLFGEQLPLDQALRAHQAAQRCDVMLVIGTSAVVQPAASLVEAAKSPSTLVVEINPEPVKKAAWLMDIVLPGPAEEVLDRIDREMHDVEA
jgi:NAD-dependent deacetylase